MSAHDTGQDLAVVQAAEPDQLPARFSAANLPDPVPGRVARWVRNTRPLLDEVREHCRIITAIGQESPWVARWLGHLGITLLVICVVQCGLSAAPDPSAQTMASSFWTLAGGLETWSGRGVLFTVVVAVRAGARRRWP